MAEEKQMQQIRAAIEKSSGSTQAEKEENYFKARLDEIKKSILVYSPNDKRVTTYSYPSHLLRPIELRNAVYFIQGENPSLLKIALLAEGYEIVLLNYEIETLKAKKPVDQGAILSRFYEVERLEFKVFNQGQDVFPKVHFWIAKRYYDLFCVHPTIGLYLKCRKYINAARPNRNSAIKLATDEMLVGLQSASDGVKQFHQRLDAERSKANISDLCLILENFEDLNPEAIEVGGEFNDNVKISQKCPGDLIEWAYAWGYEGGGDCYERGEEEKIIRQKANALDARCYWNQLIKAHNNLAKVRKNLTVLGKSDQKKQKTLEEQKENLIVECKFYFGFLIKAISSISLQKYLDPQIIPFLSKVTPRVRREGYFAYSWEGGVENSKKFEEPKSSNDVSYPRSSNGQEFDEFRNSILSEGLQLCQSLAEKFHPKVKELAKKIGESQKLNGIHFLNPSIFEPILAMEALGEEVLKIVKDQKDHQKLKAFASKCRRIKEEIVSIRNTPLIKKGRADKFVKNDLENVGASWQTVRWISHKNCVNVALRRDKENVQENLKEVKNRVTTAAPLSTKPETKESVSSSVSSSLSLETTPKPSSSSMSSSLEAPKKKLENQGKAETKSTSPGQSVSKERKTPQPLTELGKLIRSGDLAGVQKTITTEQLELRIDDVFPPLTYAVIHGEIGIVGYLLERGADINAKDAKNKTALERAIEILSATSGSDEHMHFCAVLNVLVDGLRVASEKLDLNGLSNLLDQLRKLEIAVQKFPFLLGDVRELKNEVQKKLENQRESKSVSSHNLIDALKASVASGQLNLDSLKELHDYLGREMQIAQEKQKEVVSQPSAPLSAPPKHLQLINSQKNNGAVDLAQKDISSVVPEIGVGVTPQNSSSR